MKFRSAFIALMLIAVPRLALACPVCFGDASSPMAYAANRAIFMMLVLVGLVLAAFASFFVYLMRRARSAEALAAANAQPHEVTAQC